MSNHNSPYIVGFTGTRIGMSSTQNSTISNFLRSRNDIQAVHHGDCIGSDMQFHNLVRLHLPNVKIIIHPPIKDVYRAFCEGDEILEPKHYLDRNIDIVTSSNLIIATPKSLTQRGGTWFTIHEAWANSIPTLIINIDGTLVSQDWEVI